MPAYKRARASPYARTLKRRRTIRRAPARQLRSRVRGTKYGFRIPPHFFHRWVTALNGVNVTNCTYDTSTSVLTQSISTTTSACSLKFSLADLPNVSEFTTLFDQYRISGIKLQIKMINNPDSNINPGGSTQTPTNFYPTIWYVQDYDDDNTQTLAQIKEFERVRHKVLRPNQELNIMVRPRTLVQMYRTSTTTGYSLGDRKNWLDLVQTDIPHYGLKMVFDYEGITGGANTSSVFQFKINAKFYFNCKGTR